MKKTLLSFLILGLFIYGVGLGSFFPSLNLLRDSQWNTSLFFPIWGDRILSAFWILPTGFGFWGWTRVIQPVFFSKVEQKTADLLGMALTLCFFSIFIFGLAINEILFPGLTIMFFLPLLPAGLRACSAGYGNRNRNLKFNWLMLVFGIPVVLWGLEFLSAPVIWDAILDHYRFAREVSRLHQILFHWVNHTGDMPKAAELVLAGFWNLGGESLCKVSSALPALLTLILIPLFCGEWKGGGLLGSWIFLTCPFFLAIFSWGYVEGFLVFFEVLAVYCFWKSLQESKIQIWLALSFFFMGMALAVKYTAVFALGAGSLIFIYEKLFRKNPLKIHPAYFLILGLPVFPWIFKNWLAYGNPVYPLALSFFGGAGGYSPDLERGLLNDTGLPQDSLGWRLPLSLWRGFFTASNQVNAPMSPLLVMSLPWVWEGLKKRMSGFLLGYSFLFLLIWLFWSSSFRHAAGAVLVLALLASMAWEEGLREKRSGAIFALGMGSLLSLWLCLSAQWTVTAPYASALGLENPLLRLKRHYSFNMDTYRAYEGIEEHSEPKDKVLAFAVFQTYPLNRIAFVDFKWKKPIFYQWASGCKTAEELAGHFHREGVRYFLWQAKEAEAMAKIEKDFNLNGLGAVEYGRFWKFYMKKVGVFENNVVFESRVAPLDHPQPIPDLPGASE